MKIGKNHCYKILILALTLILISVASIVFFPKPLVPQTKFLPVIINIRIPEVLISIVAGSALALAGSLMQIILDNPLASPFTLGLSSACSFGASIAIIIGINGSLVFFSIGLFAFLFGLISIALLLSILLMTGVSQQNIILIGVAINFFFSAANTVLKYYAPPDAVYQMTLWMVGSLTNATLQDIFILLILLFIVAVFSAFYARDLSIIQQGERVAIMKGINVNFERILFLTMCSLITAFSVTIVGIIGFIGIICPHISRLIKLKSPKELILSSMIIGGLFLVFSDIISKSALYPSILPIGAVTSFLGIPILVVLLFIREKTQR